MNQKNTGHNEQHVLLQTQNVGSRIMPNNEDHHLLQTVFDASPNTISVFSIVKNKQGKVEDFKILMVNRAGLQLTNRTDLISQLYSEAYPQTKENGVLEVFIKVAETGEMADFEQAYEGDGLHHWFRLIATLAGNKLVVTAENITAQKLVTAESLQVKEHQAKKATEKYHELFLSIEQGFCSIQLKYDENGKPIDYQFLEVSPSFEQQTGIKDGTGKWMRDIAADQEEFWFETYGRIADKRIPERFEYFSTPLKRWWSVYAFPINEPELKQLGVLFNDITEQIKAKKKIEDSELQFRNVLLQSPNIFVILEGFPEMIISFANEPLFKSWGRTAAIIGKPLLEVLPEIKDQPFPKLMQRVFETGKTYYSEEEKAVIIKNGVAVDTYYKYVYQAIFDDHKKVTGVTIMATDITEQILLRKKTEENEKELNNVFLNAPAAIAIFEGPEHKYILANKAYEKLSNRKAADLLGKNMQDLFPELKGTGTIELYDKVLETGESFSAPEYALMLDLENNGIPRQYYFNFSMEPLKNSSGKIYAVLAMTFDITEQVTARRKVEGSEKRYSKLLMESPFAVAILKGHDMVIALANDAIKHIWGKGNDIENKSLFSIMPEIKDQGFATLLEQVYTTGEPFYGHEVLVNLQRNGHWEDVYFNFVYQPYKEVDETISGITIIAHEVTTQAIANKKIAAAEQSVRNLFMQAPAIICMLRGPQHVFEMANETYLQLIGKRDVLEKTVREVMPELEGQGYLEFLDNVYATGEPHTGNETPAQIDKGNGKLEEAYFNFVYQPTRNSKGEIDGILMHGVDVTEQVLLRKRIEESKELQTYLLKLSDGLRDLSDPLEIEQTACKILGEQLQVSRVVYGDVIDEQKVIIKANYVNGVAPIIVTLNAEEFGLDLIATYKQHEKLIINNVVTDPRFTDAEKQNFASINVVANASIGLLKGGRLVSIFGMHQNEPREWTSANLLLMEETAERTWAAVERAKTEKALSTSKEKYRTLFNSMDEGFCTLQVLYDENGKAIDCLYLDINPAFEIQSGLKDVIGKTIREVIPDIEDFWIDSYGRINETGEAERSEHVLSGLEKVFEYFAFRFADHGENVIAVIFNNITNRKNEENLQKYILKLSDAIKVLIDPVDIQLTACRVLGEQVKASRVLYAEVINEETLLVKNNYVNGVQPIIGNLQVDQFGENIVKAFKNNEKVIVSDINSDSDYTAEAKQNFLAVDVVATVGMGLVKGGRLVAMLGMHYNAPRNWTSSEIVLLEVTAERTWAAVERANSESALRTSEEKYRVLFNTIDQGFCTFEMIFNEEGEPIDIKMLEVNTAYEIMTGVPATIVGKYVSDFVPDLEHAVLERYGIVVKTGEPVRFQQFIKTMDRWFDVHASRVNSDGSNIVAAVFNNITDRKIEEERQSYIIQLSDALKNLTDPTSIQLTACRILGEHLKLSRVLYAEVINEEQVLINHNYVNGVVPIIATVNANDFGRNLIATFKRSEKVIFSDINTDAGYTEDEKQNFLFLSVVANVSTGLLKDGRWVATLGMHQNTPREWNKTEIGLLEETAERTWAAVERAKAEEAMRISEEKYRTLFNSIDEAVSIVEIITDDNQKVIDFICIENNPAFSRITGMPENILGRRWLEFMPSVDPITADIFEQVIATGQPIRKEYLVTEMGRCFDSYFTPTGGTGSNRIVCVYNDVTDRRHTEDNLAFLADINLDFAPVLTMQEVMERVAKQLSDHLHLSRCVFSNVDLTNDSIDAVYEYKSGKIVPSMLGTHHISDNLTEEGITHYSAGKTAVVTGITGNALIKPTPEILTKLGIGSLIDVPNIENGKWNFLFTIVRAEAGEWRKDEVELVEALASKIYIRIQRAMAEEALRVSEHRLKSLTQSLEKKIERRTADLIKTTAELASNLAILQQAERLAQIGSWEYHYPTGSFTWSEGMYILFDLPHSINLEPELYVNSSTSGEIKAARQTAQFIRGGKLPLPDTVCIKTRNGIKTLKLEAIVVNDADGNPLKMIGVNMDITAVRASAKKMQEQAHFIQSTNEALPDILFVMNLHTKETVYINHTFEERMGYPEVSDESEKKDIVSLIYEEDVPAMTIHLEDLMNSADGEVFEIEYRIKAADGSFHWFSDRNTVFKRDRNGIPTEKIGIAQDVTVRKKAEQQLKETNISLTYANENLKQFASIAAHDLQEPLRKIQFFTSVIKTHYTNLLPAEGQEVLQKINKASARMSQLIREVLEYSKIAYEGKEFVQTDLHAIILNVLDDLDLMTKETGAEIIYVNPLPAVAANPLQMHQLFSNIITNAVKYRDSSRQLVLKISVTHLSKAEVEKYPQLLEKQKYIQITIGDNGIGFQQVYAEQIFSLFERLHNDDHYEGTGVGLALCKKIVENHNGHIFALSKENIGTVFQVILPLQQQVN